MDCESIDCKKVCEEWIFLWFDNEMGEEMVLAFRSHISDCPHCAEKTQFRKHFLAIFRKKCVRQPPPGDLRDKILAKMPHRRVIPVRSAE